MDEGTTLRQPSLGAAGNAPSGGALKAPSSGRGFLQDLEAFWATDADDELCADVDDLLLRVKSADDSTDWNVREINVETIVAYYAERAFMEWDGVTDVEKGLTIEDLRIYSDKTLRQLAYQITDGDDAVTTTTLYDDVIDFLNDAERQTAFFEEVRSGEDTVRIEQFYQEESSIENLFLEAEDRALTNNDLLALMSTDNAEMVRGVDWVNNTIDAMDGNDGVLGGALNDEISGGAGSDLLMGMAGNDTYVFAVGDGHDTLMEGVYNLVNAANEARSWKGRDHTEGQELDIDAAISSLDGDDGGEDRVILTGGLTIQQVDFARGSSAFDGSALYIGYGAQKRLSGADSDFVTTIFADTESYAFALGEGTVREQDYLVYENDILLTGQFNSGSAVESFELESGSKITSADLLNALDEIQAYFDSYRTELETLEASGRDAKGYIDQYILTKWQCPDLSVNGTVGNDVLELGDGHDVVFAGSGNDVIDAGFGNDEINGGSGDDIYIYNRWDGSDLILETSGSDTLIFGADILLEDLVAGVNTDGHLVIALIDEVEKLFVESSGGSYVPDLESLTQKITFQNWNDPDGRIELFSFDSGQTLTAEEFESQVNYIHVNSAPTIGDPVLLTDSVEDSSLIVTVAELLANSFDADDDPLSVANVSVDFGSVTDNGDGTWMYQPPSNFYGGVEFSYNITDGIEFVPATASLSVIPINDAPVVSGPVSLGQVAGDDSLMISDDELLMNATDVDNDTLSVVGLSVDSGTLIDNGDGTWKYQPPNDFNGTVNFSYEVNDGALSSVASASIIVDTSLNVVSGDGGSEFLYGTSGMDLLLGQAGDDVLYGYEGSDIFEGGYGNDTLVGDSGNDSLTGGAGNDILYGGSGDDTFHINLGTGQDTIRSDDSDGIDTLVFGDGIALSDLSLQRCGNDLKIIVDEAGDQVTLENWYLSSHLSRRLDRFSFSDGTTLSREEFLMQLPVFGIGNSDDNLLHGYEGADILQGNAGNDTLYGYAGNDILGGGAGSDTLSGGAGDDVFLFNRGDGHDRLLSDDIDGTDTLAFGEGIARPDLTLLKNGYDLVIQVGDTLDQVSITSWFHNSYLDYRLDHFSFADGSVLSREEFLSQQPVYSVGSSNDDRLYGHEKTDIMQGKAGNDVLYGYDGNDFLEGGDGNDTLLGGNGDDRLTGGTGNDILYGGSGDDDYLFDLGDRIDAITDDSGNDSILFGDSVTGEDVVFLKLGNDLLISYSTEDQITLKNYSGLERGADIETVSLSDGRYLRDSDINRLIQDMSAYAVSEGISLTSVEDFRQYESLMSMFADSWHEA